jgi:hypothetical protein
MIGIARSGSSAAGTPGLLARLLKRPSPTGAPPVSWPDTIHELAAAHVMRRAREAEAQNRLSD